MADQHILLSDRWGEFRPTGQIFDIFFERDLPHSVETVWNAITNPEQLGEWLGKATVDLRVGGTITIDFQGMNIVGQILQLKDKELLEYTWTSDSFPGEISVVHWALTGLSANSCRLQFREKLVAPHYLTGAGPGWHYVLDTLALALDGKPIPVWNDNAWQEIAEQAKDKYKSILGETSGGEGSQEVAGAVAGSETPKPAAKASLLIRKPAADVYEAFIDPAFTTQFWFSRGSGKLEVGKPVTWFWDDYGVSADVTAQTLTPHSLISWTWPAQGNIDTTVTISIARRGENAVFVTAEENGWPADTEGLHEILVGQTEGWALVLTGLKAFLEYGIRLNLVADHNPGALKDAP